MTLTLTSPDPEPEEEARSVKVVSTVTHHTLVAGNVASTNAKSQVAKPSTARNKIEVLDIENLEEYKAFAKEIKTVLPTKVTILVDMARSRNTGVVYRGGRDGSDDEDVHGDNPGLYDSNRMTDLERSLARFRGILEKRYQNDHDAGYTYISPKTATLYPLTPQMMKDWCQVAAPPNNISDIGHMATIISSLMDGPALLSHQALRTPPRILHVVQDQDLVDLAMTKGDVICLKAGTQDWWKGPEARKKWVMLRWRTVSATDPAPINRAIQIHKTS
ncbi:hypothetical protein B0H14DRAFT_2559821 [Mycena olivaceomarginata]|nr:hypothetical protein B0H14DRAFT_2559821 [Mycena olivaceomarginata]